MIIRNGYISCFWHGLVALGIVLIGSYMRSDCRFMLGLIFRPRRYSSLKPMSGVSYFEQYRK